jgi:membrane protease YdiL (CAAX protease family)
VVGAGLVALAARVPSAWAVLVTATVGALGAIAPIEGHLEESDPRLRFPWVVALGTIPFFVAASWMRPSMVNAGAVALFASLIAAVAEELFFRRLVFGWLSSWGPAVAIVGSAALFALVHVPVYGLAVLPVDFAAGLIFGWQRRASGSWHAPALTHSIANLLASM